MVMAAAELTDGFEFYVRFAKPLVLHLSSPRDRVLAAAWVQKLKDEGTGPEKLRTDYLKLLLFVLQKGKLFGLFTNNPGQYEALEEFPMQVKLRDIAKAWIEGEESHKRARLMEGLGDGIFPPLTTECSANMLEYVAAQDIPNFGIHAYYAISNEPINNWENLEKGIFPKGALSAVKKAESATGTLSASAKRTRSRSRSRSRSRAADDMDLAGRDKSSMGQVSFQDEFGDKHYPGKPGPEKPSSPLGSLPPPDRSTPTWGSNLIGVGDPPTPEGMAFAPEKEKEKTKDTPSKSISIKDSSAVSLPRKTPPRGALPSSTPIQAPPGVRRKLEFTDAEEPPSFFAEEDIKTPPRATKTRFEEAPSLPYQTPPWDMSAPSLPYQTPPRDMFAPSPDVTPITIPPRMTFDITHEISTPTYEPYLGPLPKGEISDLFGEEPPSFLEDEDIMVTPPRPSRQPFEEAPSLPYQTPPWDMSAASVPYRTPPWDMGAPSLPYQTPPWDMSPPSLPYQTPPWDMSAPSLPYQTPPRDRFTPSQDVTPTYEPYLGSLPEDEPFDLLEEEPPSFLEDEDVMLTPPRQPYEEAPSLPYQTPPWDMSAASVPYRTPPWDMSAASLPYKTPPYDPIKMAEMQYASLFDSPPVTAPSSRPSPRRRAPTPPTGFTEDRFMDDFSQYAEDFSTPPTEVATKKLPKQEVQEIIAKGISASPEAQDIIDDAIREMSMTVEPEEETDLEELYAEEEAAYPGRIKGMRTPPIFSKSARIREAGKRMKYPQEQFELREPVAWQPAEQFMPSQRMPTSPKEDLREKLKGRPFKELFPGVEFPTDYMPIDDYDDIDLFDEEDLVRSPKKRDLQRRLIDVMNEIDRIGDEVPAMGGIGLTTPKRSPSPVRSPDKEDDDLFFYTEKPPEGFGMSPEDYLSPISKAEAQWQQLQEETMPSPQKEPSPSPQRFATPEFLREQRRLSEMPRQVLFPEEPEAQPRPETPESEPEPEPPVSEKRRKKKKKRGKGRERSARSEDEYETDEEEEIVDHEVEELYKSLVQDEEEEEEELAPPAFLPATPVISKYPPIVRTVIPIPPKYEYESPPITKITREEYPDAIEFEEEPSFVEPWLESPPTPPSPFEYQSPESPKYSFLDESPPLKELLEAHEFTDNFFDPNRPHMSTSVTIGGRRVPIRRRIRAPPLSPIPDYMEDFPVFSPDFDVDERFERAMAAVGAIPPPTPEAPVCPKVSPEKAVCKKSSKSKRPKPSRSKTKMKRPSKTKLKSTSKTKIKGAKKPPKPKSPVASTSTQEIPPEPQTSQRPETTYAPYRPLTQKEHFFVESFNDPKHRELMARVQRLVADVGSPLIESPPLSERDEFEDIEGIEDFDTSIPDMPPLDEDLPELSPRTPPSPLPEIPEFDFQSDMQDFMSPPYKLPVVPPISPRSRSPQVPPFIPFPYEGPPSPPSPGLIAATSPELLYTPPMDETISSPDTPSPDSLVFQAEILEASPPTFYDTMKVRPGPTSSRSYRIRRHSPASRHGRIYEVPETEEFEEHMPFHERVAAMPPAMPRRPVRAGTKKVLRHFPPPGLATVEEQIDYPGTPFTGRTPRPPPRMPPPRPRIAEEATQLIDIPSRPYGSPEERPPVRRRPSRIKRRTAGRRIDFDSEPPSPQTPKRPPVPEMYDEDLGPPPEDLFDEYYPMEYEKKTTIMDYSPPTDLPEPQIKPKKRLLYFPTPSPRKYIEIPKKYVPKFELPPKTRIDYESPIEFAESPEPLYDEDEFDFPMSTALPGFPPPSPYQLPPSPEKIFGRQMTPEARRRGLPTMAARLVTPPRERKPPAPGLVEAQRQFQRLLMDTPPEEEGVMAVYPEPTAALGARRRTPTPLDRTSPDQRPTKIIEKTSKTTISPREKRTVTTIKETSPITPPRMIVPPRHEDPFLQSMDVDLFAEEMPDFMEPSSGEKHRRAIAEAPQRTTRRRMQLYGYGERKPVVLERKPKPPALGTVEEAADEPRDDYEYWPGPFVPQVTRPPAIHSGGRLAPPVYPNVPPVSAKGFRTPDYFSLNVPHQRRPVIKPPPPSISPVQEPPRKKYLTKYTTARKRLDFDDSPKSRMEYLERLVADVPTPEDFYVPQLPPVPHIEFQSPEWSPVPIRALEQPGMRRIEDMEPPEGFESPRTPKQSPELPFADMDQRTKEYSPPMDFAISPTSPLMDVSPPPGMDELLDLELTPPSPAYRSPESPPEALIQRIRQHQFTKHASDREKQHISKYIHVKGRPYRITRAQPPALRPLEEEPEVLPLTPPYVREETRIDASSVPRDPMHEILAMADRQYAMLLDSPEKEMLKYESEHVIDEPPATYPWLEERLEQMPEIPPLYQPPPYPPMPSPERFVQTVSAQVRPEDMLDFGDSPPLLITPPRDIFAEVMEMEEEEEEDLEALLTGSPVRRSPPGSITDVLNKMTSSELLDSNTHFAKDNRVSHSNYTPTIQKFNKLTPGNTSLSACCKHPFNDLAYCVQKGLDYFPVKENETKFANLKKSKDVDYVTAIKPKGIDKEMATKLKSTNSHYTDSANKVLFSKYNPPPSHYIVGFYYYLNSEDDHKDRPLSTNIPHNSVNTSRYIQQRQTPSNLVQSQCLSPTNPNTSRNEGNCGRVCSPVMMETIYRSPQVASSAMASRSSICFETESRQLASSGNSHLPLTTPRSTSFQRLSPKKPVIPNDYGRRDRSSLPSSTLQAPPTTNPNFFRNNCDTLPNFTAFSTNRNFSRNTTNNFVTLPNITPYRNSLISSQNAASKFATPHSTNPNFSRNIINNVANISNVTPHRNNSKFYQNNTSAFVTLPNITPNTTVPSTKRNTGIENPSNVCACVLQYLNRSANSSSNRPGNIRASETIAENESPKFRTSTPRNPIKYRNPEHFKQFLNDIPHYWDDTVFHTLPNETPTWSTLEHPSRSKRQSNTCGDIRKDRRQVLPYHWNDTTTDFHTLPQKTPPRSICTNSQSPNESNTCGDIYDFQQFEDLPRYLPRHLNDATNDFYALPQETPGSAPRGFSQAKKQLNTSNDRSKAPEQFKKRPNYFPQDFYDTTTDFYTLPQETPSRSVSRSSPQSKRQSNTHGDPYKRQQYEEHFKNLPRYWDDTVTVFQTLPTETLLESTVSDSYQSEPPLTARNILTELSSSPKTNTSAKESAIPIANRPRSSSKRRPCSTSSDCNTQNTNNSDQLTIKYTKNSPDPEHDQSYDRESPNSPLPVNRRLDFLNNSSSNHDSNSSNYSYTDQSSENTTNEYDSISECDPSCSEDGSPGRSRSDSQSRHRKPDYSNSGRSFESRTSKCDPPCSEDGSRSPDSPTPGQSRSDSQSRHRKPDYSNSGRSLESRTSKCDPSCAENPESSLPVRRRLLDSPEDLPSYHERESTNREFEANIEKPDIKCDPSCSESLDVKSPITQPLLDTEQHNLEYDDDNDPEEISKRIDGLPPVNLNSTNNDVGNQFFEDDVECDQSCCSDDLVAKSSVTKHFLDSGQCNPRCYNDIDLEKISKHVDGLPSQSFGDPKNNNIQARPISNNGLTHLIISTCGPLYVTSIPSSSNCTTTMKFKPIISKTCKTKLKLETEPARDSNQSRGDHHLPKAKSPTVEETPRESIHKVTSDNTDKPMESPEDTKEASQADEETIKVSEELNVKEPAVIKETAVNLEFSPKPESINIEATQLLCKSEESQTVDYMEKKETQTLEEPSSKLVMKVESHPSKSTTITDEVPSINMTKRLCDKNLCPKEKSERSENTGSTSRLDCVECIAGGSIVDNEKSITPSVHEEQSEISQPSLKSKKSCPTSCAKTSQTVKTSSNIPKLVHSRSNKSRSIADRISEESTRARTYDALKPIDSSEYFDTENFVRSIPLECINYLSSNHSMAKTCSKKEFIDAETAYPKVSADMSTCTDTTCDFKQKESQPCLNRFCNIRRNNTKCALDNCRIKTKVQNNKKSPYESQKTKYFKTGPCMDISLPVTCTNPYCGGSQVTRTTTTNDLLLDDWEDALDFIDDSGHEAVQRQNYQSPNQLNQSTSYMSGCNCDRCD